MRLGKACRYIPLQRVLWVSFHYGRIIQLFTHFKVSKLTDYMSQLVGLIRTLRSVLIQEGITINGTAPAATITGMLPAELAAPYVAMGVPVSTTDHVGRTLVYVATAR